MFWRILILLLAFCLVPGIVRAQSASLPVAGTSVEIAGDDLYEVTIQDSGFIISLKGGSAVQIISPERRKLTATPGTYTSVSTCDAHSSSLRLSVPSTVSIADIQILIDVGTCDGITPLPSISASVTPTPEATTTTVPTFIRQLRSNPQATYIVKHIGQPITPVIVATGTGGVVVVTAATNAAFAFNLSQLVQFFSNFRFYILGLFRFRKKNPWGRVLYANGEPAYGATVQIYEAQFNKLKDSQTADKYGRFSALVAPGSYFIRVLKKGFETEQTKPFRVESIDQAVNIEIVIRPIIGLLSRAILWRTRLWNFLYNLTQKINPVILTVGTALSILDVLVIPRLVSYIILAIYGALDSLQIYFLIVVKKPFGRVLDENQKPVALAIIRVFEQSKQLLLATKVSDEQGRFSFLISPGRYYFTCAKAGFEAYTSETINIKSSGVIDLQVFLKRASV